MPEALPFSHMPTPTPATSIRAITATAIPPMSAPEALDPRAGPTGAAGCADVPGKGCDGGWG